MTTAEAIIIVAFALILAPIWMPLAYAVVLIIIGTLAFAFGMAAVGVLNFCDWCSKPKRRG